MNPICIHVSGSRSLDERDMALSSLETPWAPKAPRANVPPKSHFADPNGVGTQRDRPPRGIRDGRATVFRLG